MSGRNADFRAAMVCEVHKKCTNSHPPILFWTLIAGGLALTLLASATVPGFTERLDSLRGIAGLFNEGDSGYAPDGAIVGRATSNLAAVGTFVDHPVIGVGPGIYYLDYSRLYANRLGLRYFA